jgi:predicted nucleic acid-binding protein
MFANRFTAFIDACSLASALRRNLLLTLAEADFFRVRWSTEVLDETEKAIAIILAGKVDDPQKNAARARKNMETAFEDACVDNYQRYLCICDDLPDPDDAHVVAAAVATRASIIVTENLKDFPPAILGELNIEARSSDAFIADTIALDPGRAVAAIRRMRERFKKPEKTAELLFLDMEAAGLTETVDVLRPHIQSL